MQYTVEVAIPTNTAATEIGNFLEKVVAAALQVQGFEVVEQVRLIASEVDLLCRHNISGERIYVECKAYRDTTITGAQLRQLLGTVQFEQFSAGWLVGMYSSVGSEIEGAVGSLAATIPLPQHLLKALAALSQASRPRSPAAGTLPFHVPMKMYLVWSGLTKGGLEDVIEVRLDTDLDKEQAIKSTVIVGAELLNLRTLIRDSGLTGFDIFIEDPNGVRWWSEVDLASDIPVIKSLQIDNE